MIGSVKGGFGGSFGFCFLVLFVIMKKMRVRMMKISVNVSVWVFFMCLDDVFCFYLGFGIINEEDVVKIDED